jgi:hypothetical protein
MTMIHRYCRSFASFTFDQGPTGDKVLLTYADNAIRIPVDCGLRVIMLNCITTLYYLLCC